MDKVRTPLTYEWSVYIKQYRQLALGFAKL